MSEVSVPAVASSAVPAAASVSPAIIGGRGPNRAVSGPLASEPTPTTRLIGSNSSPVVSTGSCRDCCRNSDKHSSDPYSTRLKISPTPVAPLNSLDRNSVSGSTGLGCRRSVRTKNQPAMRPTASRALGPGERSGLSHPCWPAVMKPAVSAASVITPSSNPGTSVRPEGFVGDSGTYRRSIVTVSRHIGTFTRKMDRQPARSTRAPPSTGPSATPSEPIAPHTPSARARARGSGNWCTSSASEQGSSADAPRPWTARAAIRTPSAGAAAQAAEPAANALSPSTNTFLAPMRSAVDPAVSMIEARARV